MGDRPISRLSRLVPQIIGLVAMLLVCTAAAVLPTKLALSIAD